MEHSVNESENVKGSDHVEASISKNPASKVDAAPGMFAVGTEVEFVQPVIRGKIAEYHLSDDKKTFSYLVDYINDEGQPCQRAFTHNQLKQAE
jgi:hypothetical protein